MVTRTHESTHPRGGRSNLTVNRGGGPHWAFARNLSKLNTKSPSFIRRLAKQPWVPGGRSQVCASRSEQPHGWHAHKKFGGARGLIFSNTFKQFKPHRAHRGEAPG